MKHVPETIVKRFKVGDRCRLVKSSGEIIPIEIVELTTDNTARVRSHFEYRDGSKSDATFIALPEFMIPHL
jgi:hypothetical protein